MSTHQDFSWIRLGGVGTLPPAERRRRGTVMRHSPDGGNDRLVAYLRDSSGAYGIFPIGNAGPPVERNALDYSVIGNGTTQDAAAINTLLQTTAQDGDVIRFPRGTYLVDTQITYSNKQLTLIFERGAKIKESGTFTVPIVYLNNADGSAVRGMTVEGSEVAFVGATSTRYALEAELSDDVVIDGLIVTNRSRGLLLDRCNRARVRDVDFTGLVDDSTANVNFHTAVEVSDGDDCDISGIHARDCGSALLVGASSVGGVVTNVIGRNCYDNGVYLSSAIGWQLSTIDIRMDAGHDLSSTSSGVKMRGSYNTCTASYVEGMRTGYTMTGLGSGADAFGATGVGSEVIGCVARDCIGPGIYLDDNAGFGGRDFVAVANRIVGCGAAAGSTEPGIKITAGHRHTVALNEIVGHLGNGAGISASGTSGSELTGLLVTHNKVRNHAGGSSAYALQFNFVDASSVFGLEMFDVTAAAYGLRLVNSDGNEVMHCVARGTVGTTVALRVNDAGSTGNRLVDNFTCTVSDVGTGTVKWGNASAGTLVVSGGATISGDLTVNGSTTLGDNLTDSVNVNGSSVFSAPAVFAAGVELGNSSNDLTAITGRFKAQGGAFTVAPGTEAGTTATATPLRGCDTAGAFDVVTGGAGIGVGVIATVTFAQARPNTDYLVRVDAASINAADLNLIHQNRLTTGFDVRATVAPGSGETLTIQFFVTEVVDR